MMVMILTVFCNFIFIMKTLVFTACEYYYHGLVKKEGALIMNSLFQVFIYLFWER